MTKLNRAQVAQLVDHTLLKPEATADDVRALVAEGERLGVFAVCVSPSMLPLETSLPVAVVCGFPSGKHTSAVKAAEAAESARLGAAEVDMVIDIGAARAGDYAAVEADIAAVRQAAPDVLLKVIIESATLTDEQIVACCEASERAGADYVKTSTGFHPAGGASAHAVRLMRETVGDRLGVKASGGIRTSEAAAEMIEAGASRLGLSGTESVLAGFEE